MVIVGNVGEHFHIGVKMIIAECSQNFDNFNDAATLVWLAYKNGADLAKFQLFDSQKLYGKQVPAELSFENAKTLFDYGKGIGIEVFFSVFDVERVKWCEEIGVKRYKIASRQWEEGSRWDVSLQRWFFSDFIEDIFATGKQVIASTQGKNHLIGVEATYLYCVPKYPAGIANLSFCDGLFEDENDGEYSRDFDGFSDHAIGLDASKVALARGAQILEKHFSVSHDVGIDGQWSMTPSELAELVRFQGVVKQCV